VTTVELGPGTRQATPQPVPLSCLLASAGLPSAAEDALITGITADSRRVQPGSLFVCYRGIEHDGHDYAPEAAARGAAAIVCERPVSLLSRTPTVLVQDGRQAWARLLAAWYGFPSRRLLLVGVTGTDGKTTTVTLLHHILSACGLRAGLIATTGAKVAEQELDTGLHTTTPAPDIVQELLARMVAHGAEAAIIEATSEGLAQHRLDGCEFDIAVLTNITHDHLYYHGSFEAYREAKARLFASLATSYRKPGTPKISVLNKDDASFAYLRQFAVDLCLSYGAEGADLTLEHVRCGRGMLSFRLRSPWGSSPMQLPLPGAYNAYNVAAAIAAACGLGVPFPDAVRACESFQGVVGRMEPIQMGQPFNVFIDFAHTPNALEHALRTARSLCEARVIVVFGCAGERDRLKRRPMGALAVQLADYAIFTAEDPRREDLEKILAEMEAGAQAAGGRPGRDYEVVADRAQAIERAISLARPGDIVLLCGKGHERSMCYGTEERPWSEHAAARAALEKLGYRGQP